MIKYKRINLKDFIFSLVILLAVLVPFMRYYVSTPDNNDCMKNYVENMKSSGYSGYIYNINGAQHIEPANSSLVNSLEEYKVGEVNGCISNSGNLFSDINNTVYCSLTYVINHAPVSEKLKEPMALMDGEAIENLKETFNL